MRGVFIVFHKIVRTIVRTRLSSTVYAVDQEALTRYLFISAHVNQLNPINFRGESMNKKVLSVSGLLLGASLIAIVGTPTSVFLQTAPGSPQAETKPFDRTSLEARVRKEKAKGVRSVTFPAPLVVYAEGISLDDAVSQTTVVIAGVTEKHSRQVDSHTIGTFYRLSILETLSQATPRSCCLPKDEDLPGEECLWKVEWIGDWSIRRV